MKRFLMLVGVAAVAAAMYVAASPASQQATGPTAKQFNALKKQVATLSKKLKSTKSEADAAVGFIATCLVDPSAGVWGVSEFGDSTNATFGYDYTPDGGVTTQIVTALDFDGSANPQTYLQAVNPSCVGPALKHRLQHESAHLSLAGQRKH
jgi:outer membrane murein-binding lipoprotein Lpp